MSNETHYFQETDEKVVLLVEDKTKEPSPKPHKKKKCGFRRFAFKAIFVFMLFGLYKFVTYIFSLPRSEFTLTDYHPRPQQCNPTIPYNINQTFEADPKTISGFGVGIGGRSRSNLVRFIRHDSDKITFDSKIFVSSVAEADRLEVGSHTKENSYHFYIKGPDHFHSHNDCFKAEVIVGLPKSLDKLDNLWVHIPVGEINTDFGGPLTLQKLNLKAIYSNLSVKDKAINQLSLATISGNIEVANTVGESVHAFATHGSVKVNARANNAAGASVDGNVELSINGGKTVTAKTVNGNALAEVTEEKHEIENIDPEHPPRHPPRHPEHPPRHPPEHPPRHPEHPPRHPPRHPPKHHGIFYEAAAVNGNTKVSLPASFKGRFDAGTFNGKAEVSSNNKGLEIHFSRNLRSSKQGYVGEEPRSESFAKAGTFNGNAEIIFT